MKKMQILAEMHEKNAIQKWHQFFKNVFRRIFVLRLPEHTKYKTSPYCTLASKHTSMRILTRAYPSKLFLVASTLQRAKKALFIRLRSSVQWNHLQTDPFFLVSPTQDA